MTHDEMRFLRRELINHLLHVGTVSQQWIKLFVRQDEVKFYGHELQAYK